MWRTLSLKAKIISGSIVTLILIVIIGGVGINATNQLTRTNKWVDHTHVVIGRANDILAAAVDMETGMRGYLLAGQEAFLGPYTQGQEKFYRLVDELSKTVDDNPAQVALLGEIRTTVREWQTNVADMQIGLRREIGDAKSMNHLADIVKEARGKVYFDKFRSQIATFIDRESKLMTGRRKAAAEATAQNEANAALITEAAAWVDHTHNVITAADELLGAAVDMETGMRGYLLAGKEAFLDPYKSGRKRFDALIADLIKTVDDNPAQVQLLKELGKTRDDWMADVTEPAIAQRREVASGFGTMDDIAAMVGQAKGKAYFDKIRSQIATFIGRESELMVQRKTRAAEATRTAEENRRLIAETAGWVDHTQKVMTAANEILAAAVNMETGMRGYLLAGKEEFLAPYKEGRVKFDALVARLSKTVDDNPAQVQLLGEIKTTIDDWQENVTSAQIGLRREIGESRTMDDMAALVKEARGKVFFDKFRAQIGTFIDRESKLMARRQADAKETRTNAFYMILGGIAGAILLGLGIAWFLATSIARPLRAVIDGMTEASGQVTEGSSQVADASQSLAEGSSQQAASIEETSSSMEEMASMTKRNAESASQADSLMKDTRRVVEEANTSMARLTTAMEDISRASDETSKIIKTIDEIAFQTNLLALNAAVEAARAGEAGAGFAVVADEVRNLAMRAADAAKDTAHLIDGTVKQVNLGSEMITAANDAFGNVASSTEKVGELVAEINSASLEQSEGIEQVNNAVSEMDKIVQQNAANAEESASASEEMRSQAEQLTDFVQEIVHLVAGSNGSSAGSAGQMRLKTTRSSGRLVEHKPMAPAPVPSRNEIRPDQVIPFDEDGRDSFKDF